jgi:hypothetical protein
MKLLALDVSTKTGFAVFDDKKLVEFGLIKSSRPSHYKADVKTYKDLRPEYPTDFINTAESIAKECLDLAVTHECPLVIIEHTEKGRARLSQRLLEWINLVVAKTLLDNGIQIRYLFVSDWRTVTKCYLKYWPEYKAWNSKIAKLKLKALPTKSGAKIAKIEGKIVTKVDQKKLSIILANEAYGLELKDDNIADAVNLGRAACVLFDRGLCGYLQNNATTGI